VEITVLWDQQNSAARVLDSDGELLPAVQAFWFAWFAFHPDTKVFTAP